MVLIFWQGIISIHQKTFLEALAKQPVVHTVVMVTEKDITPYRQNMGWETPTFHNVRVIVAPSENEIDTLFREHPEAIHIFGGLRHKGILGYGLKAAIKQKVKIGLMSEPYDRDGFSGQLRRLKYTYYKQRYSRHIQFILAIGREGVSAFRELGFSGQRIFPWAYFVSVPIAHAGNERDAGVKRIFYAGRIEEGKGILKFVRELADTKNSSYTFDIYGQGGQEAELNEFISARGLHEKIRVRPFLKYDDLLKEYGNYDWVVLPSTGKDGWGVIVSEGLLNGLKAICSNKCGASWAVKDGFNGVVFNWLEADSCSRAIDTMLNSDRFAGRENIRSWAAHALSAEAGAYYFLRILDTVYSNGDRPGAPWEG